MYITARLQTLCIYSNALNTHGGVYTPWLMAGIARAVFWTSALLHALLTALPLLQMEIPLHGAVMERAMEVKHAAIALRRMVVTAGVRREM